MTASKPANEHPSSSSVQRRAESLALPVLSRQFGVELLGVSVPYHGANMQPDGKAPDDSMFVEVFAHIGRLKSGQLHKISTDTLKLVALRERYPDARLILAFVDQAACDSVVGWRAAILRRYDIEKTVVKIPKNERVKVAAAQVVQKMVNTVGGVRDDEVNV